MTDSAPAPPTLDGDLDVLESIEFIKAEFWLDMLSGAIKVCVNILVAMFLLLIFTTIIKIVLRLVKAIMNNPQRPVPEQLAKFIAAALKIVLWMQIVPILVNKIGIAALRRHPLADWQKGNGEGRPSGTLSPSRAPFPPPPLHTSLFINKIQTINTRHACLASRRDCSTLARESTATWSSGAESEIEERPSTSHSQK